MKNYWVIDIGNTSVKYARVKGGRLSRPLEIPTHGVGKRSIVFRGYHPGEGIVLASVVPRATQSIIRSLRKSGAKSIFQVTHRMELGIGIRYPQPEKIGADRLVNAVAAVHLYGSPAVVIDFGTAVTFDVISTQKEYIGGVIAPGLKAMTNYLHEQTALLPRISLKEPRSVVGKSTVEAMRVGAVVGYRGLIREILNEIRKSFRKTSGKKLQVIATGGHSRLIAAKLPEILRVDPELTLKGLKLIGERMFGELSGV